MCEMNATFWWQSQWNRPASQASLHLYYFHRFPSKLLKCEHPSPSVSLKERYSSSQRLPWPHPAGSHHSSPWRQDLIGKRACFESAPTWECDGQLWWFWHLLCSRMLSRAPMSSNNSRQHHSRQHDNVNLELAEKPRGKQKQGSVDSRGVHRYARHCRIDPVLTDAPLNEGSPLWFQISPTTDLRQHPTVHAQNIFWGKKVVKE